MLSGELPEVPLGKPTEVIPEVPPEVPPEVSPEVPPELGLDSDKEHEYPSPFCSNSMPSITTGLHSHLYPFLELSGIH